MPKVDLKSRKFSTPQSATFSGSLPVERPAFQVVKYFSLIFDYPFRALARFNLDSSKEIEKVDFKGKQYVTPLSYRSSIWK